MAEQSPSIGRIVHYVSYGTPGGEYGKECRAAIITKVYTAPDCAPDGTVRSEIEYVGLAVLNPTGLFFDGGVKYDGGEPVVTDEQAFLTYPGGTWHWPERV